MQAPESDALNNPAAVVGLSFFEGQLWLARENGLIECYQGADFSRGLRTEPHPVGLLSEQGSLWVWGRQQISQVDQRGQLVSQQPVPPSHTVCRRGDSIWTADDHRVRCYQLIDRRWQLHKQFKHLQGCCRGFDVSHDGRKFLRTWPGQGYRWHVATYDCDSGQQSSEFKRGALWLNAVFSANGFTLMATGWHCGQVTAISYSGGSSSEQHRLMACAWAGPLFHFDERIVVICQGGLQSFSCGTFPAGQPEYAWSNGYAGPSSGVIASGQRWRGHKWYPKYANRFQPRLEYDTCPVTAVASCAEAIAVGHSDGTVQIHHVSDNIVKSQGQPLGPVRAIGESASSLLILDPRKKRLMEVPFSPAPVEVSPPLEIDDYWPPRASEWGQLFRTSPELLLLCDRYQVQCLNLHSGGKIWSRPARAWATCTRLLPWRDRLYHNQSLQRLVWLDSRDGQEHSLQLQPSWAQSRLRLFSLGQRLVIQALDGAASRWGIFDPASQQFHELLLCSSWSDATESASGQTLTLSRHQIPSGETGNVCLLNAQAEELGRWQIPWCSQLLMESDLQRILGVSVQRLLVYDLQGSLLHSFQGHAGAIVGFRLQASAHSIVSWDEFGWVRRWSLA